MTVNMEKVLEYRDILRECIELQKQLQSQQNQIPDIHEYLTALKECVTLEKELLGEQPKQDKPKEPKPKGGVRKKIDRGRVFALHRAGWSPSKIAEDVGCSANAIYHILGEFRDEQGGENGQDSE